MYRFTLCLLALSTLFSFTWAEPAQADRKPIVAEDMGAELDAYMQSCALFGFSGSVLVARGDEILLRKGYGEARPGEGVMNGPETLFDIASASKQITAAAILKLESMGKLSTSDSIAKHLADVPKQHKSVKIQHLLNHTSGFSRYGTSGSGPDRDKAVAQFLSAPRARAAGAEHEYYNGGYTLLAAIVERASGQAFEDWVAANLFAPAGMEHTHFADPVDPALPHLSRSHDGGKLTSDYIRGWGYKGMGGVITSVSDLHLWLAAVHSGKVLPKKALKKWLTPGKGDYACGWYVTEQKKGQRVVSHGGTAPGFQSYIRHFVDGDVLVLVASNRSGMHWQVTWGLSELMVDEPSKIPAPPTTLAWDAKKLDALAGVYESKKGGRIVLSRAGQALRFGAESDQAMAILDGKPPTKKASFQWERKRATSIIAELLEGSSDLLGKDMLPHIPASWPQRVLDTYWPKHLASHGQVTSHRVIGATEDARSGRVRVWMRLQHPETVSTVEVAFVKRKLNIFDMAAPKYLSERTFAPTGNSTLATYDFSARPQPTGTLQLSKSGKATLQLESGGKRYSYKRIQG